MPNQQLKLLSWRCYFSKLSTAPSIWCEFSLLLITLYPVSHDIELNWTTHNYPWHWSSQIQSCRQCVPKIHSPINLSHLGFRRLPWNKSERPAESLLFAGRVSSSMLGGGKCGGTMRSFVFKFDARPIYISENVLLVYGTSSTSCSVTIVCDGRKSVLFSQ